ncbi:MAG: AAA family ATPase [Thermoanaerobaculia bacterium]
MTRDLGTAIRGVLARAEPVLVFLAGPNGAGKSTFFRDYLQELNLPFVNADEMALRLRESSRPPEPEDVDGIAFEMTERLRLSLLARRQSFCTETVFSDPQGAKLDFLKQARASGYWVCLVFIGLSDSELSTARVMQRVAAGGHDVPDEKLRGRFSRTLANLQNAVSIAHEAFLFDNSSDRDPFRLVAIYSEGQIRVRVDPLPDWTTGLPEL